MKSVEELHGIIEKAIIRQNAAWNHQSPLNLYQPVAYAMSAGGKRLRPLLVLMGYQLFDGKVEKALSAALAIEVFHNFTLLHDDIMDKADKRRGQPTVHKKFSENSAILSGDAMSFLAYRFLLESQTGKMNELLSLFTTTALEVCEGQQMDMDFETRNDVTVSEYIEMIRLKTAVLLGCALKSGALLGGASPEMAGKIYDTGINLGIAFQLQDDYLDTFGDETTFGKKIGNDIVSNKKTFLLIEALETAGEQERQSLLGWMGADQFVPQEKIDGVKKIFAKLEIQQRVENEISAYTGKAVSLLADIEVDPARKIHLETLCNRLSARKN